MALTARIQTKLQFDSIYAPAVLAYDMQGRVESMTFDYGSVTVVYTPTYFDGLSRAITAFTRVVTDG